MKKSIYTIFTFTKINTKTFFRDPLALFFTIAFPLIFLFVFGGLFSGDDGASFNVALINKSESEIAENFVTEAKEGRLIEVAPEISTLAEAKDGLKRGELAAAIVLPPEFGATTDGSAPTGEVVVYFTRNNAQAGQTLTAALEAKLGGINSQYVDLDVPFTVAAKTLETKSLSTFDYIFAGLLGFSIIGLGIFGPTNVFPELKKQGVLRRFHTTPLKVWQFFIANAISRALEGLVAIGVLFAVALLLFDLQVVGNYFLLAFWIVISIVMILGIGLALGGWAKNQRQVAPLSNIVVFPMLFLSGTFFPRYLMPEWLQTVSAYLPLTPVIEGVRRIITEGVGLIALLPELYLIGAWMLVIYYIAFLVFRWE